MTEGGFELQWGMSTVVFGPNGSGKTTLLRRLFSEHHDQAAYQPQQAYLFRGLMGDNLGLGLTEEECGLAGQFARQFGLEPLLSEPAFVASGGERARLVLARTLARSDELVLLDEPLAAVDLAQRAAMSSVLREAVRARTAVIVTHELEQVVSLGDRLAVMFDGRVQQQGSVDHVMAQPSSDVVARTVGVANLYQGVVVADDGSIVSVDVDGIRVIGSGDHAVGNSVRVLIPAEAVTLISSGRGDELASARNRWVGTVQSMEPIGRLTEVVVDIGVELRAIVTPGSVDHLGLQVGSEVSSSVKAASVRVVSL